MTDPAAPATSATPAASASAPRTVPAVRLQVRRHRLVVSDREGAGPEVALHEAEEVLAPLEGVRVRRLVVDVDSLAAARQLVLLLHPSTRSREVELEATTTRHLARRRRRRWGQARDTVRVSWDADDGTARLSVAVALPVWRSAPVMLDELLRALLPHPPRVARPTGGWHTAPTAAQRPVVDIALVNPVGFDALVPADADCPQLRCGPRDDVVVRDGAELARWPAASGPTESDVAALRGLRGLEVVWGPAADPGTGTRSVASLACAGVPLTVGSVPRWARDVLGVGVLDALAVADPVSWSSVLRREEDSVRLRRAALRTFAPPGPRPEVSVLAATRRPEMVAHLLDQVARQRAVEVETVLALHGFEAAHPAVAPALERFDGPLVLLGAGGDVLFGDVLERAVDAASCEVVTKMDDDDWYGVDHLADMLLALRYSGADLVGANAEFVHLEELDLTVRRRASSETLTRFVAGGTMTTSRTALREVGGWRPVPRHVDKHLIDDVLADGGVVYRTHPLGMVLRRRGHGHTWSAGNRYFLREEFDQARGLAGSRIMGPGWSAPPASAHPSSASASGPDPVGWLPGLPSGAGVVTDAGGRPSADRPATVVAVVVADGSAASVEAAGLTLRSLEAAGVRDTTVVAGDAGPTPVPPSGALRLTVPAGVVVDPAAPAAVTAFLDGHGVDLAHLLVGSDDTAQDLDVVVERAPAGVVPRTRWADGTTLGLHLPGDRSGGAEGGGDVVEPGGASATARRSDARDDGSP